MQAPAFRPVVPFFLSDVALGMVINRPGEAALVVDRNPGMRTDRLIASVVRQD